MIIFVVLASPTLKSETLEKIAFISIKLYIFFILLVKTDHRIFLGLLSILVILFVINLKKNGEKEIIPVSVKNGQKKLISVDENLKYTNTKTKDNLTKIEDVFTYVFYCVLPVGVISYIGQKKQEFKSKFSYYKFVFGVPKCKENFTQDSIWNGIIHALD
jgi:hypothetical protein